MSLNWAGNTTETAKGDLPRWKMGSLRSLREINLDDAWALPALAQIKMALFAGNFMAVKDNEPDVSQIGIRLFILG